MARYGALVDARYSCVASFFFFFSLFFLMHKKIWYREKKKNLLFPHVEELLTPAWYNQVEFSIMWEQTKRNSPVSLHGQ